MSETSRLAHFPISFFAMVMGLSGLTIATEKAETTLGLPLHLSPYLTVITAAIFAVVALGYLLKLVRHADEVRKDLHHPVKISFFPTISISLILLAICTIHTAPALSELLWQVGTVIHLLFTLYVLGAWINHTHFEIHHMNPAWFIPVVGNILVPIAGVAHGYVETSWFFFSVGLLFWLVLLVIVFNRFIFHHPLPDRLVPTFFILIAPPAVGFLSYLKLTGEVDAFARVLFYSGLFLTLLLFTQIRKFARLQFFLSWWAYSFPMAAITVATLAFLDHGGPQCLQLLGTILFALLVLIIVVLVVRTLIALARRQICVPE